MWPEEKNALQCLSAVYGKCLAEGKRASRGFVLSHEAK